MKKPHKKASNLRGKPSKKSWGKSNYSSLCAKLEFAISWVVGLSPCQNTDLSYWDTINLII